MPTISLENGGVKVTVWREKNVVENVVENIIEELTERQRVIYYRLIKTGRINVVENVVENSKTLAAFIGTNDRTIQRELAVLQSKNVICHKGSKKTGYWEVKISDIMGYILKRQDSNPEYNFDGTDDVK